MALGHDGYLFLPANNNREVFLTVKPDNDKMGLRDRDYLRDDEIKKVQAIHPNLRILHFSTFENYIYHPDNLSELKLNGFDGKNYKNEIVKQKNEGLLEIVGEIGTSRTHYIEFKDCIRNDENIQPIIAALKSDDMETFYPYFNMKRHFSKAFLNQFDYKVTDLAKTKWFKKQILEIIK